MNNEQQVVLLNNLLKVTNTRLDGYQNATKLSIESDVKTLYFHFMQTSQRCKMELMQEVLILDGKPEENKEETGEYASLWIDIEIALKAGNRNGAVTLIKVAEEMILDLYRKTLKENVELITAEQQTIIREQLYALKNDLHNIAKLAERNSVKKPSPFQFNPN